MTKRPRTALVTNVLAHYRVPCFEALAARLPGQIDFYVLAGEMAHRSYVLAQEESTPGVHVLPGWSFRRPPFDDLHLNDPRPVLRGYDLVILSGWAEPSYVALWSLLGLSGKRVGFWIESTLNDGPRNTWKELPKQWMVGRSAGVIATGTSVRAYCEWLGVPRERIHIAPNAVNSAYFAGRAKTLASQRETVRAELGLNGVVILFVGRMVEFYKNVSALLDAHKISEQAGLAAQLVLVGEGPDRAGYEAMVREQQLKNVRFVNFLEHEALCRYYAAADIFVLPSRSETWGLVINEAMEFGLPIVTTDAVGAAPDLVSDNGFVAHAGDAGALAKALEQLARDPQLRSRMGARSREIIAGFTPETWADGFVRGLEAMME